ANADAPPAGEADDTEQALPTAAPVSDATPDTDQATDPGPLPEPLTTIHDALPVDPDGPESPTWSSGLTISVDDDQQVPQPADSPSVPQPREPVENGAGMVDDQGNAFGAAADDDQPTTDAAITDAGDELTPTDNAGLIDDQGNAFGTAADD